MEQAGIAAPVIDWQSQERRCMASAGTAQRSRVRARRLVGPRTLHRITHQSTRGSARLDHEVRVARLGGECRRFDADSLEHTNERADVPQRKVGQSGSKTCKGEGGSLVYIETIVSSIKKE